MNGQRIIGVAGALALIACATAPKAKREVVWPDPPDKPRIRFVESFSSQETLDDSGWSRFKRSVLGSGDPSHLVQPMGLALSADGQRLYVADFGGSSLYRVDLKERRFEPFATNQGFAQPFGIALDDRENVYVTDSGTHSLTAYSREGDKLWSVGNDLERPTGLCIDRPRGVLYVVDSGRQASQNHRVFAYDLKGSRLREIGSGRGTEDAEFMFPVYCAVDSTGRLYVGDSMNFRIQMFAPDGTFAGKYGENGDAPGTFARIKGIDFDSFGNIYVADGSHAAVQIFNRDWDVLMNFGGPAPFLEYFDIPSCVAIDRKANRIYVCNEHNARINAYDLVNTTASDSLRPKGEGAEEPAPPVPPAASPGR